MMGMGEGFLPGFLLSLAAGVALGAFYDSLRVLRMVLGGGRRRQFFTDLLFMAVAAPVTFWLRWRQKPDSSGSIFWPEKGSEFVYGPLPLGN